MIIKVFNPARAHVGIRHKPEASVAKRVKRRPPRQPTRLFDETCGRPHGTIEGERKARGQWLFLFPPFGEPAFGRTLRAAALSDWYHRPFSNPGTVGGLFAPPPHRPSRPLRDYNTERRSWWPRCKVLGEQLFFVRGDQGQRLARGTDTKLMATVDRGTASLTDRETSEIDLSVDSTLNDTEYLPPTTSEPTS